MLSISVCPSAHALVVLAIFTEFAKAVMLYVTLYSCPETVVVGVSVPVVTVVSELSLKYVSIYAVVAILLLLSPAVWVVVVGFPASATDEGIETEYVPEVVIGDVLPVIVIVEVLFNPTLVTVPFVVVTVCVVTPETRPCASVVIIGNEEAVPYVEAVPTLGIDMVPLVVMVPPLNPAPAVIDVTVPEVVVTVWVETADTLPKASVVIIGKDVVVP